MSLRFRRTLPVRPSLDQQKKLAKELLQAFRAGEHEANERIRAELPDKQGIALADAQFVLAREYGFSSWRELRERIEALAAEALPPVEQFRRATEAGDVKSLRRVLQENAKARAAVNEPLFGFNSPALVAAAGRGDVELVGLLLEFGADPNRKSSWWAGGFHPLYAASGAVAERLIAAGAVPDACAAAHLDRPDLLSRLLEQDPSRVRERGGDGQTPLHFARSRSIADMLLDAGADINAIDVDHRSTAAEWMLGEEGDAQNSRMDLAKYLVERGARADIFLTAALGLTDRARALLEGNPTLLSLRTSQGEYGEKNPSSYHIYQWTIGANLTPLQTAAKFRQTDTVRMMERFASPEQRLLLACNQGMADEARAIVREHPDIVNRLGNADRRALTDEAWAANAPAVEIMLELGFDPSAPSVSGPTGGTALHCAAWEGSVACVGALLRYPAGRALIETRERTYNGTPLSWCSHGSANCHNSGANHVGVARMLIDAGVRVTPDMADWEGSDAFMAVIDAALRGA
ncbi:MAG TPA: ankyrin repeat domain-containing protein [Gemmatimonadaceae bacterium]|nr:ankyrin repeat domain-containing protein [Gemmatimonadaceae bacterium]